MSVRPPKPCVVRPASVPDQQPVHTGRRMGRGRFAIGGKGLLGSLLFHGCLIAAACTVTLVQYGGQGSTGGSSSGEGVDFQMFPVSRSSLSEAAPRSHSLPVLVARNRESRIVIPDVAEIPPLEPVLQKTTDAQTSLASSLEPALGESPDFSNSSGKGSLAGEGKHEGKSKGVGRGSSPAGKSPVVAPPKLISSPAPRYPSAAKAARTTGRVAVLIRVRGDGTAASAKVYHGSGHAELDQAAVDAARSWTFSKSPSLGPSDTVDVVVQVNFSL